MAEAKTETKYARIRALRQTCDFNVGGPEVFEEGDVIDVPDSLLDDLSPDLWEVVSKTHKRVRNPVKFYTVDKNGLQQHYDTEPVDVAKAKAVVFNHGKAQVNTRGIRSKQAVNG